MPVFRTIRGNSSTEKPEQLLINKSGAAELFMFTIWLVRRQSSSILNQSARNPEPIEEAGLLNLVKKKSSLN
jgi:hypothetical protein